MDLILIDQINIGERFRKDPGNISDLTNSIESVGLLHPIVIDSDYNLIAGLRRLLAYKKLGETSIPCNILDPEDIRKAEADENIVRQDFTNSEIHAIHKYFHETESRQGERIDLELLSDSDRSVEYPRDKVAKIVGKHPDTISKINQVMYAESDDPGIQKRIEAVQEKIDEQPVDKSYKEIKKLTKPQSDKPDPEFLVNVLIETIKKQDDKYLIFSQLHEILGYPDGCKILKSRVSKYIRN